MGTFFLREDDDAPIVLLASGTGFAPIKSIVEQVIAKGRELSMALYWGGRRPHDLYMNALAEQWAATVPGFRYVPVVSDALPEDAWRGREGFVHRRSEERRVGKEPRARAAQERSRTKGTQDRK